ncbi:MAG: Sua5/YciO/YrdC/YwlC family protein, partial [Cellulomonas sp.]|nr:Sua5/YciO/YrdC/YwlC family protein [Cellulomonas sp.]
MARRSLLVTGVVQGVGFRPHVYRLAVGLGVVGSVRNTAAGVVVDAQAAAPVLDDLARRIAADAPPLADVRSVQVSGEGPDDPTLTGFSIVASAGAAGPRATVPPDCAVCDDCLAELFDPADRRFRHPFITCTNCGPRFTIITAVPYDRPSTSMAGFPMCARCTVEYHDPADRRFHAQPIACPDCGPHLWADSRTDDGTTRTTGDEAALALAQQVLADGGTVAVKGLGGYHLACRADDATAVARLRARKHRPDKPFALMARDLTAAARLIVLDGAVEALLADVARPIVLAARAVRQGTRDAGTRAGVVDAVAPGAPELGVMLAYTPLHHLLMTPGPSGGPVSDVLVMT